MRTGIGDMGTKKKGGIDLFWFWNGSAGGWKWGMCSSSFFIRSFLFKIPVITDYFYQRGVKLNRMHHRSQKSQMSYHKKTHLPEDQIS